jgi:hypothetical protein
MAAIDKAVHQEDLGRVGKEKTNNAYYAVGAALFDYATEETDATAFKIVAQKALDAIYDEKGEQQTYEKKLNTVAYIFSSAMFITPHCVNSHYGFLVERALDYLEKMTTHDKDACERLLYIGRGVVNETVAQPIMDRLPKILAGIKPEDAVYVAWHLHANKKYSGKYHDFICQQVVDAAKRISDPHSAHRLWALGYVGLNEAGKNTPAACAARDALLDTIAKTASAPKLMYVVYATRESTRGAIPNATIDEAAANKMQSILKNMDLDARFDDASDAIRFATDSNKTCDVAVKAVIAAAKEYTDAKKFPSEVEGFLKLITWQKLADYQQAEKILALFPSDAPPQATPASRQKPPKP